VVLILKEIAGLSAQGLTGAVVALSFSKQLVQPIRDRVHLGFEYWGRQDPTRGWNRKVPREEAANQVARMMQGPIRDRGCLKTHCLKRPTRAEKVLEFWSPAPLPEGDAGKDIATPADLKKPEAAYLEVSSDSSIGDGSDVEVVGASAPPAAPRWRKCAVRKILASKAGLRSALPKEGSAAASRSGSEELEAEDTGKLSGEGTGVGAGRAEGEATAGLARIGGIGSPPLVPRPQPPAALLRLSFTARQSAGKRKEKGSADETRWVETASSNPLVESPPRSRAHREATPGEAEAEGTRRSAARKATPMGVVEVPPVPPSPLP